MAEQCLSLGAKGYLEKPFTTIALFDMIATVTGTRPT